MKHYILRGFIYTCTLVLAVTKLIPLKVSFCFLHDSEDHGAYNVPATTHSYG